MSCDSFYCWPQSPTQVTNAVSTSAACPWIPHRLVNHCGFFWASPTTTQCHLVFSKSNKLFLKSLKSSPKNLKIKTWPSQSIASQAYLEKNHYIICLCFHSNNPNLRYKIMGSELIITAQDGMMMVMKIQYILRKQFLKWRG